MRPKTSIAVIWPALLGVLAAHQIAYSGHDDGHIHGYLETVGPALVVAAILGWIWSWASSRVDFRSILSVQVVLFVAMEGSERVAATSGFAIGDLATIGIAVLLLPLVSGLTVLVDRLVDFLGSTTRGAFTALFRAQPRPWTAPALELGAFGPCPIRGPPSRP